MCRKLFLSSTVLFVLLSLVVVVEADTMMWSQTYGGPEDDAAQSLVETSDGGYAIAGRTSSFGAGGFDFWLVKTDEFGFVEWNQTYGGTEYETTTSLVVTSDGGYAIAGNTFSFGSGGIDAWLVKTDAYGNMEWNRTFGGTWPDEVRSLAVTSDGGYVIVGSTESFATVDPDITPLPNRPTDVWLIKTDAYGNMEWNKTYGSGTDSEIAHKLVVTSDGGYAILSETHSAGTGGADFWLFKTDEYGNMEWDQKYGGPYHDSPNALIVTSDGGYALAGDLYNDFWLFKTDEYGNMEWNWTYGGINTEPVNFNVEEASSLVELPDGGYALVGFTQSFGAGKGDWWLVKTNEYGEMEWNQTYGGTEYDAAYTLVATSDGGFALAGYTRSFGAGESDFWLIKTDEFGVIPEYSSWLLTSLLLIATLVIVTYKKKLLNPNS